MHIRSSLVIPLLFILIISVSSSKGGSLADDIGFKRDLMKRFLADVARYGATDDPDREFLRRIVAAPRTVELDHLSDSRHRDHVSSRDKRDWKGVEHHRDTRRRKTDYYSYPPWRYYFYIYYPHLPGYWIHYPKRETATTYHEPPLRYKPPTMPSSVGSPYPSYPSYPAGAYGLYYYSPLAYSSAYLYHPFMSPSARTEYPRLDYYRRSPPSSSSSLDSESLYEEIFPKRHRRYLR